MVMLDPSILEFEPPETMPPLPKSRHKAVLKLWPSAFTPPPNFKLIGGSNRTRNRWLDALQEESIEPLRLLGAKLTATPRTLANTITLLGQVTLKSASVAAGPLLRGGRRVRCRYEAQANRIRVKQHYEREQEAKKAAREHYKPWVTPNDVDPHDGEIQANHPDFKIAKEAADKFKKKYHYSDYDDLRQKANVVLLDEKEYFPGGHEYRHVSIKTKVDRRLSYHCVNENRSRQIFEQPPEQPEGDESESTADWSDCAAARWSPRPERASRVTAVLRTGKLNRTEWQIWKLLAGKQSHIKIASALGLSSHDVVYHTKEKIKALLLRRQPDKPAASPPTSSVNDNRPVVPSEPSAFERLILDARRLHPSRGDVRAGHASGISAVAHTRHCIEGLLDVNYGRSRWGADEARIDALGLEFVEIRYFNDSTHPKAFASKWELRPKAVG
jgi:hypothetical protein